MQIYIMQRIIEGRTKLYFSTMKTSDELLAVLEVRKVAEHIDLDAVIYSIGCFYPKRSIVKEKPKEFKEKYKETLKSSPITKTSPNNKAFIMNHII